MADGSQTVANPLEAVNAGNSSSVKHNTEGELVFMALTMVWVSVPNAGDLESIDVYCDANNPPTTKVATIGKLAPVNNDTSTECLTFMVPNNYYWKFTNIGVSQVLSEILTTYKVT